MAAPRPFALIHTEDQWLRAAHTNTALRLGEAIVQLDWEVEPPGDAVGDAPAIPGGLVFDPWCRLYRSVPEEGQVQRLSFLQTDVVDPLAEAERAVDLFTEGETSVPGDFTVDVSSATTLKGPQGVAFDGKGRLFVAETDAYRVLIFDIVAHRLLGWINFSDSSVDRKRPLDLAGYGDVVYATAEGSTDIFELNAQGLKRPLPVGGDIGQPERIDVTPEAGAIFILTDAGTPDATVVPVARPAESFSVPFASDLAFQDESTLVVARRPGESFLRFSISPGSRAELSHLKAKGYDGRAIVRSPAGRIGFWTTRGFRTAVEARKRFARNGRVSSFRLDSGHFQMKWGRLFIDACIPKDSNIRARFITADEPPDGETLARTPPANIGLMTINRPDLSPPMPPSTLLAAADAPARRFHRRFNGREQPWNRFGQDEPYETYEMPILAPAGRYLWVILELTGNGEVTPEIRSIRAEYPSHQLMRLLPQIYSRDIQAADFLLRYLANLEGFLNDLDGRATARRALLDPKSVPAELLPWLGQFVGLLMDERWPVAAKRMLIEEAVWLFRFRGTVGGLKRFLEIYLSVPILLIEHFRVRGLGGAYVGAGDDLSSQAVLGAGFRIGGRIGRNAESMAGGATGENEDAYAHRFSVVIPALLDEEQRAVVEHILETHRPAHTAYYICTVDAGMKLGVGLYAGLTTLVGVSDGFDQLRLGETVLGRKTVIGKPGPEIRIGSARLGRDSRAG